MCVCTCVFVNVRDLDTAACKKLWRVVLFCSFLHLPGYLFVFIKEIKVASCITLTLTYRSTIFKVPVFQKHRVFTFHVCCGCIWHECLQMKRRRGDVFRRWCLCSVIGGGRSYLCVGVVNWKSRFIRALAEDSPLPFQDNEKIGAGIKIWPLQKLKVHQGRKMNNLVLPQAEFWVSMPFQFTYIL